MVPSPQTRVSWPSLRAPSTMAWRASFCAGDAAGTAGSPADGAGALLAGALAAGRAGLLGAVPEPQPTRLSATTRLVAARRSRFAAISASGAVVGRLAGAVSQGYHSWVLLPIPAAKGGGLWRKRLPSQQARGRLTSLSRSWRGYAPSGGRRIRSASLRS